MSESVEFAVRVEIMSRGNTRSNSSSESESSGSEFGAVLVDIMSVGSSRSNSSERESSVSVVSELLLVEWAVPVEIVFC